MGSILLFLHKTYCFRTNNQLAFFAKNIPFLFHSISLSGCLSFDGQIVNKPTLKVHSHHMYCNANVSPTSHGLLSPTEASWDHAGNFIKHACIKDVSCTPHWNTEYYVYNFPLSDPNTMMASYLLSLPARLLLPTPPPTPLQFAWLLLYTEFSSSCFNLKHHTQITVI